MEEHLRPVRTVTLLLIGVGVIASSRYLATSEWITVMAGVAVASALFWLANRRMARAERPEWHIFAAWLGTVAVIAACVAVTGGPSSPGVAWLAIPVATLSTRFSERGVAVGAIVALAALVAATVPVDATAVVSNPALLFAPAVVVVSIALLSMALMRSELHYRGQALIDPLTALLNRKALGHRVEELTQQAHVAGQPVAVILADIDNFKRVNDSLGHAAGDAVLIDLAYLLRKRLRAFDLAYRLGGEEFLILVPGANLPQAAALAADIGEAVAAHLFTDEIGITLSLGVSGSGPGERFDYPEVFAAADAALYEAKRAGRNRVMREDAAASKPTAAAE